jgi:4-amino-4-deoxy-L-arabinose transferase-like glycosyltransferase
MTAPASPAPPSQPGVPDAQAPRAALPAASVGPRRSRLRDAAYASWPFVLLAILAFAVRWPNLWYIPQFTDEVFDAQVAYGIWEGKRPLIGVNAYTGAIFYYLLAGLFWLFGPSIYTPRAFVMVLGVLAVLATALLAADLGRRAALRVARSPSALAAQTAGWIGALVGGGLLATSGVHVLTNSHLSWPHATLPLYLTLTFWLLERAVGGSVVSRSGWLLAGAGFCFGLAQQQHPTMLLLWPVFLGYVAWKGWRFFRTRWAYIAMLAFLVGISPLIVYNLTSDFGTLRESQEQTAGYQEGRSDDFSYGGRAIEIAQTVPRIAASAFELRSAPVSTYLLSPITWVYTALGVAGLVIAARLGVWSLPIAVVTFLLLLPFFPASHDQLPRQARYLMPLFPLIFASIGGLAAVAWVRLEAARAPWCARSPAPAGGTGCPRSDASERPHRRGRHGATHLRLHDGATRRPPHDA